MDKHFWQSKVFWANAVTLLAALLPPVRDFLVQMGWPTETVVALLAVVNIALRLLTNQPIRLK